MQFNSNESINWLIKILKGNKSISPHKLYQSSFKISFLLLKITNFFLSYSDLHSAAAAPPPSAAFAASPPPPPSAFAAFSGFSAAGGSSSFSFFGLL